MCGIAGVLTRKPELDLHRAGAAMLAALRHRGPDGEGLEEWALPGGIRLVLAHTRLAVLDPSPAGRQPMTDPASGSWIAYNGEVYNHASIRERMPGTPFVSSSDTETVLKAWVRFGPEALEMFRGMFAFALYDGRRRQFWLVRDRLGVKPLYAARVASDGWVFASELRAVLGSGLVPRRLDPAALGSYLGFGAVTAPTTLVHGVQSLMPAESWRFDLGRTDHALEPCASVYWCPSFSSGDPKKATGWDKKVDPVRPVVQEAIRLRMVSDIPVGIFLSGGIDSSSLVAVLAGTGRALQTFSVVLGDAAYDESGFARLVASHFGTDHHEVVLGACDVLGHFDEALGAYDQPSMDGLNTYFVSRAAREAGVRVALSGIGGDEVFAGYPHFRLLARLEGSFARVLAQAAGRALGWMCPGNARARKLVALARLSSSRLGKYLLCRQLMDGRRVQSLLQGSAGHPGSSQRVGGVPVGWHVARRDQQRAGACSAPHATTLLPPGLEDRLAASVIGLDAVNAQSLLELSHYVPNVLLRDTDQMSMAHGLEVREPLLDHRLIEEVARVPGPKKLSRGHHGCAKALLVDALPNPLPPAVLRRKKMGFVLPWERWLRRELRGTLSAILCDAPALAAAGLDAASVAAVWADFQAARPGVRHTDILCLASLLVWVRRHLLTLNFSGSSRLICRIS